MRPATLADLPAALEVVLARDVADLGAPDFTLEDLREEWTAAGFALASDAMVIESAGGVVAAAWLRDTDTVALVHPGAEGRGHGAALLAWAERRAVELGRPVHRQEVVAPEACALLEAAGYARVRTYWRMVIDLAAPPPPAVWPPGATWRRPDAAADAPALHAISQEAFAAVPDFAPETLHRFRARQLERHDAAPELSVVAESDGAILGYALCVVWPEESRAYVTSLAVRPHAAGRGLGTALLRTVFAGARAAGFSDAALGVAGDNPRAVTLYERAGMHRGPHTDSYERAAG